MRLTGGQAGGRRRAPLQRELAGPRPRDQAPSKLVNAMVLLPGRRRCPLCCRCRADAGICCGGRGSRPEKVATGFALTPDQQNEDQEDRRGRR